VDSYIVPQTQTWLRDWSFTVTGPYRLHWMYRHWTDGWIQTSAEDVLVHSGWYGETMSYKYCTVYKL